MAAGVVVISRMVFREGGDNDFLDKNMLHTYHSHINAFRKIFPAPVYRKYHQFFFKLENTEAVPCMHAKMDLCDVYMWCRGSKVKQQYVFSPRDNQYIDSIELHGFKAAIVKTPFVNAVVTAEPLLNANKCRVFIRNGDKTGQICAVMDRGFVGTAVIGVSLHTPNSCMECGKPASDTCKLRACSRCFELDRVRVLYCSRECQLIDYPRHRGMCTPEWRELDDSQWRDRLQEVE